MNPVLEDLMYWAGLTAQGCWDQMDEYDRKAIEKLAELIVGECAELVDQEWNLSGAELKEHFGIDK